jgi:hypothetical protein
MPQRNHRGKETDMLARISNALAALAAVALLALAQPAAAASLPLPTGPVLLTVEGAIDAGNGRHEVKFDRAMLKALPATEFRTRTIWTDGVQTFTGISLKDLLDRLGVHSGSLSAAAINDYAVNIPVSDAAKGGPIIAYAMNGKPMSVREKGPLWIVYPYDSKAAYRSEVIYSRSIWQLVRITVKR